MSPGKREAPGGNQGPDNALLTDPSSEPRPADLRRQWAACIWCERSLPDHELACSDCRADIATQIRRRRDADARLEPLDGMRWSA